METHKNFIFLSELETATMPVYQIVKETYLMDVNSGQEHRELGCAGQSLLNMIIDNDLSQGDSRLDVFEEIKRSLTQTNKGVLGADFVSFAKNGKYFKDLTVRTITNPTFTQAWAIMNELKKTIIVFDTVDGSHASYMKVKNKEIYSDGIKITFEDFLKIIYSGKTYICSFFDEKEQQEFL